MTGPPGVIALVLLESVAGIVAIAGWTQSWGVVRRGHFRIVAWVAVGLGVLAVVANARATERADLQRALVLVTAGATVAYLVVQYARTDLPGAVVGWAAGAIGASALVASAHIVSGWPPALAALGLVAGAALLGSIVNGMLLGHWYLNQPGLKPWALARLTGLALVSIASAGILGAAGAGRLAGASTEGAVLGLPGFGSSFGGVFFGIWVALVAFTGLVVWMVRRCVRIRSIQSATGLYYVAVLTAGVAEFVLRYLMVNAA